MTGRDGPEDSGCARGTSVELTYSPWTRSLIGHSINVMDGIADVLIRFGLRLRLLRKEASLSQEALADRCGLDRTYMSGIERGKRNVSLRNIEVLARALDISISALTDSV